MRSRALDIHPPVRRRTKARTALATTAAVAIGAGLALSGAGAAQAAPVTIDIVTINDFHGRLEASQFTAGAAVLSTAVQSVRTANPGNVAFISAGDNIGASTFTSFVQQDEPTLKALNTIGLDLSAAGNHEFDRGYTDLVTRVDASANFPFLAANVDGPAGSPELPEYEIKTLGGIRVAFVAAVTEELPTLVSPAGIQGVTVSPIVSSINRVADQLRDGNSTNGEADVVVAITHEGATSSSSTSPINVPTDSVFGRIVSGLNQNVSAIVSAHTHQRYAGTVASDPYQRAIIQAGQYSEAMGRLTLTVDSVTKKVTGAAPSVVPLVTRTGEGTTASPYVYTPNFAADPAVATIVADARAVAAVQGARPLGNVTTDFRRAAQATAVDGSSENRGGESTLGNFVADVQVWATRELETEVAFMNPGGLRSDLPFASRAPSLPGDADGLVTFREAAEVQPFANTLVTMQMTGAQIRQVLEQQWQPATASRPFLKLGVSSALKYSYDPTAAPGSRINKVLLGEELLRDDQVVKVVVNSFLASGGDNFRAFTEGTDRADSGRVDLQGMVDYFAAQNGKAVSPDFEQRAVGVQVIRPQGGTSRAGDSITLNLSSLLFSNGEPKPTGVEARIDGRLVGTASIDPTIVNATDEVGRASLVITLPGDIKPGDYTAVIATTGSDQAANELTLPITVVGDGTGTGGPGTDGPGSNGGGGTKGGTGTDGSKPAGTATTPRGGLASTGFDVAGLTAPAIAGGMFVLLGGGLLLMRRRRAKATTEV